MLFPVLQRYIKRKNLTAGFTLIELLVVISIIAILTAVATVSYVNVQQKSRDGKRKSDLAAIQQALEVFYADNGAYPDKFTNLISCNTNGTPASGLNWGDAFTCSPITYMNKLPIDPVGISYIYEVYVITSAGTDWCKNGAPNDNGKCQKYTLWARLENSNDPDIATTLIDSTCITSRSLVPAWYSDASTGRNYCVHSPR